MGWWFISTNLFIIIKDGFGKETWPDGSYFIGRFKNGVKDGKGAFTWSDNAKYIGDFENNLI